MKILKILTGITFSWLMSLAIGFAFCVSPFVILGVMLLSSFIPTLPGVLNARVTLSDMFSGMTGSTGGTTYSKGRYGLIRRPRTIPVNRSTTSQQLNRNYFKNICLEWNTLSSMVIQQWQTLAASKPFSVKGRNIFLTGFAIFQKCQRNILDIGEGLLTTCPNANDEPLGNLTFTVDIVTTPGNEEIKVNFTPAIDASEKVILTASPVMPDGVTSPGSKMRIIKILTSTDLSGDNQSAAYLAVFGGTPNTGQKAYFGFKRVKKSSGFSGYPLEVSAVGTA